MNLSSAPMSHGNNSLSDNFNSLNLKQSKSEKRSNYLSWDDFFMSLARLAAQRSKDPSTQVGACICDQNRRIVGMGYNGMPTGIHDDNVPWGKGSTDISENKYAYVCHAEMNAIMNKNISDLTNCTIYTTMFPCNECAKLIIQSRISFPAHFSTQMDYPFLREVVYLVDKGEKPEMQASKIMFNMAKVKYSKYQTSCDSVTIDYNLIKPEKPVDLEENNKISKSGKRLNYITWSDYFMAIACLSAKRSKDPEIQIGVCIVNVDLKVVGIGYNGMPIGCDDDLLPWTSNSDDFLKNKNAYVCHAEMNAILNKNSVDLMECTMYSSLFPCNECAKLIIQAGIRNIIFLQDQSETKESQISKIMFDAVNIKYCQFESFLDIIDISLLDD